MDTELWAKFKGTCYSNGKSMNKVVATLIEEYIDDSNTVRIL